MYPSAKFVAQILIVSEEIVDKETNRERFAVLQ